MKLSHILMLSATALFSFAACDNIDESERFEGPFGGGDNSPGVTVKKNVLIEDYTGQKCSNCPRAHEAIEDLHGVYGADRVIAVALHGGPQAVDASNKKVLGLANDESKEYNTRAAVPSYPKGVVDRQNGLQDFEKWAAGVATRMNVTPKVDIAINNLSYNAKTRQVAFNTQVKGLETVDGNLQVWLIESGIEALQTMPTGEVNKTYIHNHVFRGTVNGFDGDVLHVEAEQTINKPYTYTLQEKWNAENAALVAFYYNATDGVIQVIELPISESPVINK